MIVTACVVFMTMRSELVEGLYAFRVLWRAVFRRRWSQLLWTLREWLRVFVRWFELRRFAGVSECGGLGRWD